MKSQKKRKRPATTATELKPARTGASKATEDKAGEHRVERKEFHPSSKSARIIALLSRMQGATIKELMKATQWQPHSVRGFLSRSVVKKLGLKLETTKGADGERYYKVVG